MAKRKPNQLESSTPGSSMNALKHGLYARKWINPEEQKLYDALFDEYCAYYESVGAPEYTLIESMVASRVKILRGIKPNGAVIQKLSPGGINIILRNLQSSAGLNIESPLSGHSFRVGRALDLLESGESLPKIMLRGG